MQMAEHILRQPPRCILSDAFKNDVTDIVKEDLSKPRAAIGGNQSYSDVGTRLVSGHHLVNGLTKQQRHRETDDFGHDNQ